MTSGALTGTGTTRISSGTTPDTANFTIDSGPLNLSRTIENDGSTTWSSGQITVNNCNFNNNGTFTVNTNAGGSGLSFSGSGYSFGSNAFNNAGIFIKQGTGMAQFDYNSNSPVTFNNTGVVEVQAGTLAFSARIEQFSGDVLTGGSWIVENNAEIFVPTDPSISTIGPSASVRLAGANSVFKILDSITVNRGRFTITDGRDITPTAEFTNSGTLTIGPSSTFQTTAALTNTGTIDIAGGTLQMDQGLTSGNVRQQLLSGFNDGAWDGVGIISSLAAANRGTAVGYAISGPAYTLSYTWLGDTDLNGVVNSADLGNMSSAGTTWHTGDFNYDGVVNGDDYALFILGYSESGGADIATTLPEPGALALMAAVGILAARRRRMPWDSGTD